MQIMKPENNRIFPYDPVTEERRFLELENTIRGILSKLTPEERRVFQEYASLLHQKELRDIQTAFQSGLRTGQRRMDKPQL